MIFVPLFLVVLAALLQSIIGLYIIVVIASALITWVQPNPYNPVVKILNKLTQPVYAFMRRYIPTVFGGIDLAPMIVIFALQFLYLVTSNLFEKLVNAL